MTVPAARAFLTGSLVGLAGCGLIAGLHDLPEPAEQWDDSGTGEGGPGLDGAGGDVAFQQDQANPGGDASLDAPLDAGCTCVAIPQGWSGPTALYEGDSNLPAPSCGGGYGSKSFEGNAGLDAPPASCTACTCGAQTGAKCGAQLRYFTNACNAITTGCGAEDFALLAGACQGLGTGNGACAGHYVASFEAVQLEQSPGSCSPSGGTANGAASSWSTTAVACSPPAAPPSGSCDGGEVCAPAPAAPFTRLCITASGAQSCPTGTPFATPHVYYTGVSDTRSCTQCGCGTPQNVCSAGGTVTFWTAFNCSGTPTGSVSINDVNGAACYTLPSNSYYSTWAPTTFVPGACPASGGSPTGTVTPDASTAVTFCCTQ